MSKSPTPTAASERSSSAWKPATDRSSSENDDDRPSSVSTWSRCPRKSKSIVNVGSRPIGRVVMPRPVTWKATFHQWLRRTLAARRTLPTIWAKRCTVAWVSDQSV
jgi:hypothetical protein